jgi:uncharacterized protein Smg (DUF494 family)
MSVKDKPKRKYVKKVNAEILPDTSRQKMQLYTRKELNQLRNTQLIDLMKAHKLRWTTVIMSQEQREIVMQALLKLKGVKTDG